MRNWHKQLNQSILSGSVLLMLGLLLPMVITVQNLGIYSLLNRAAAERDVSLLILSAFLLVLLNSIRALPIYLGSYLFCSSLLLKSRWLFRALVIVIIISAYALTSWIYGVTYDFGIPSLLVILIVYMLDGFNLETVKIYKRSAILICALVGMQFLDVIVPLSQYGFGRGIVSTDIKMLAEYLDQNNVLTLFSLFQMTVFLSMAVLLSRLLIDQHNLFSSQQALAKAQIQALAARKNLEIQHLVHDLKTPLTTIEALSEVTFLLSEDEKIRDYQKRIADSAESMSEMVTQILESGRKSNVTTQELFDYSLFQITSTHNKHLITLNNRVPQRYIYVNKITFSRALVNLIENAANAINSENGKIKISVWTADGNIVMKISDNGCGIDRESVAKVWEAGYSSRGSTGLGMGYVREIVEDCGGSIELQSKQGKGTKVTITLKEVFENE